MISTDIKLHELSDEKSHFLLNSHLPSFLCYAIDASSLKRLFNLLSFLANFKFIFKDKYSKDNFIYSMYH